MCKALNDLMKDELDAREARGEAHGITKGAKSVKEAVLTIKNGVKAAEIKKVRQGHFRCRKRPCEEFRINRRCNSGAPETRKPQTSFP